ncbi:MAG: MBL fold metallo-hydrolase [Desulfobacteraceae bacterium]|jgi:7,8-dihydropterin-6-yl-methyl-4-(beta-D-ribofuranosyl)aminobenzene 5'-phosphate synthase
MSLDQVRVTLVVDNQAEGDLIPEHGLSMWIETDGKRILFDTGQGTVFDNNTRVLGIDVENTDALVISHGHYDHTGGIDQVLQRSPAAMEVYCHSEVVKPRYSIRNGEAFPIQMPRPCMVALDKLSRQFLHWAPQPMMLSETIGITGPIPRITDYEDVGGPFFLDQEGVRSDPVNDDMALWIQTKKGVIVCVGCCHSGIVNTLEYVKYLSGDSRIRAVIGGFHLVNANAERMEKTISALKEMKPDVLVPCHCTGDDAFDDIQRGLGDKVVKGRAGKFFLF